MMNWKGFGRNQSGPNQGIILGAEEKDETPESG
jgi:hypothetical protein